MIENTIFQIVETNRIFPGDMSEVDFVEHIKDIADDYIDGSNIRRVIVFSKQMYHYCLINHCSHQPFTKNEFGKVLGVRV